MEACGVCHRSFCAGDQACVVFEITVEDPALHLGTGSIGPMRAAVVHKRCLSRGYMAQTPVTIAKPAVKPPDCSTERADVLAGFMEAMR